MRFARASLLLASASTLFPTSAGAFEGASPPPRHVYAGAVYAVAFSPDGSVLATGGIGRVRLWSVATGRVLRVLPSRAQTLTFAGDGTLLTLEAPWHERGQACLWDTASGEKGRCFVVPSGPYAFSRDGRLLAAAGALTPTGEVTGRIQVFDVDTGQERASFTPGVGAAELSFSDDGHLAVTSCGGGCTKEGCFPIEVWDALAGTRERRLLASPGDPMSMALSPDGSRVAVGEGARDGTIDGYISVYDTATGKMVGRWKSHSGRTQALVFSPDGSRLYSGGRFGDLAAWPDASPRHGGPLPGSDAGSVFQLAVSPDGRWLAQADSHWLTSQVVLRDAASGRVVWSH